MKRELLGGVFAIGLLAGCSGGPEVAPHTPETSVSSEANGLPEAVQTAAKALLSIEAPAVVQVTLNPDGSVQQTARSQFSYGSGIHIGDGNILTANHVGNAGPVEEEYGCYGHQVVGAEGGSNFRTEVNAAASRTALFGDIALLQAEKVQTKDYPVAEVQDAPDGHEQTVYLVNYQSLDTNEHSESSVRSPDAEDTAMQTPAIFSGIAKRSPRGDWIVVTGDGITQEYGSGNPQRLTGGGSGGALLNEEGDLLAITTAISDSIKPTPAQIEQLTDTHFDSLPNDQLWLQYGVPVDTATVEALDQQQQACQPGSNDTIVR